MNTSTITFNSPDPFSAFLSKLEAPLSHTTVFDALQKEFCPLLDTTLVAALLADVDFDRALNGVTVGASSVAVAQEGLFPGIEQEKKKSPKNAPAMKYFPGSGNLSLRQLDPALGASLLALYETLDAIAVATQAQADVEVSSWNGKEVVAEGIVHGKENNGLEILATSASRSGSSSQFKSSSKKYKHSKSNSIVTGSGDSNVTAITTLDSRSACSEVPSSNSSPSSLSHSVSCSSSETTWPINKDALLFLQAALPQIPTCALLKSLAGFHSGSLKNAQRAAGSVAGAEVDMWDMISSLLHTEDAREMDERGLATLASERYEEDSSEDISQKYLDSCDDPHNHAGGCAHVHALGMEEEESKRCWLQLNEDERLARELALELEKEDSSQVYTKKEEGEEWVASKEKTKAKAGGRGKIWGRTKIKVKLNDVRQQQNVAAKYGHSGLELVQQSLTSSSASLGAVAVIFPSLATYLSALLPRDRSPSALLASVRKDGEGATATYIQNVFLNERALKSKYAGRVYLAVRACLERVVSEMELVVKGRGRTTGFTSVRDGVQENENEDEDPRKERRKSTPFPPEDTPRPPPRKAKGRVRTATDRSMGQEHEPGGRGDDGDEENKTLLFTVLDILLPEYALVDSDQIYVEVHQLLSDIELCVAVTKVGEDVLDLAKLLCELYVSDADPNREVWRVVEMFGGEAGGDGTGRRRGMSYAESVGAGRMGARAVASLGDRQARERVEEPSKTTATAASDKSGRKPSPYQWQAVPTKKARPKQVHTLPLHLPTYTRDVNGVKRKNDGLVWLKGVEVPGWEPQEDGQRKGVALKYDQAEHDYRRQIKENMRRRDELLREAARMYNRGKGRRAGKVGGGDVAWYFAERAREFQEAARRESLNAARAMVRRKQVLSGEQDTVDLHGTTVNEAVEIVLEMLESRERGRPLKIVTGRGSHSASGVSVLKPALKKRLVEEGWSVGAWDAGLVVR